MKIRLIQNIFDKADRQDIDVDYAYESVSVYFDKYIKTAYDVDKSKCIPIVSGKKVEWSEIPSANDEVTFVQDVTGKNFGSILTTVLGAILVVVGCILTPAYGIGVPLIGAGIAMLAGGVLGIVMGLFAPTTSTSDGFQNSQTYSWEGIQNTIGEGSTMPVVYGKHRVGGVVIESFTDSDLETGIANDKYLNVLLALSEGEIDSIDTSEIYINKQNISNFSTVTEFDTRLGTNSQSAISWFSKIVRRYVISGVKLTYNNPYIYLTNDAVNSARIGIIFPALFHVNEDGGMENQTVNFQVDYAIAGSGNWYGNTAFSATNNSKSEVSLQMNVAFPEKAIYDLRITRTTQDFVGMTDSGDSYLGEVNETQPASLIYPRIALLGLRILASNVLSGAMPALTVIVKGMKILDVRNLTAAKVWSSNPANIVYDLLTNVRYGLGRQINVNQIDIISFVEFANWCDEVVNYSYYDGATGLSVEGTEKRYEFNLVLDTKFKAIDIIGKICGTCRGIPYWEGDTFKIIIDKESNPVQMFSMGNIVADSFEEAYVGGNDIPNSATVQILDEDNNYLRTTISAFDASRRDEPANTTSTQYYGITKTSIAKRELTFGLRRVKGVKKSIAFEAGMDAVTCQGGDQILFQHQTPQYGWGGSVLNVIGTVVYFDTPVTVILGMTYTLRLRQGDGAMFTVSYVAPATTYITFLDIGVGHTIDRGDIWQFGILDSEAKPFRVASITKKTTKTVTIVAEEYNASVYAETDDIVVLENQYSQLGLVREYTIDGTQPILTPISIGGVPKAPDSKYAIPADVTNIVLTEEVGYLTNPVRVSVKVDFKKVLMSAGSQASISYYEIWYSIDAGLTWVVAGSTTGNTYRIENAAYGKTYYVLVKPYTNYGVTNSIEATTSKLNNALVLSYNAVANITGLTVVGITHGIKLVFTYAASNRIDCVEIWASATNDLTTAKIKETSKGTTYTHAGLALIQDVYYWVRIKDVFGNFGAFYPTATTGTKGSTSTNPSDYLTLLNDSITESQLTSGLKESLSGLAEATIMEVNNLSEATMGLVNSLPETEMESLISLDDALSGNHSGKWKLDALEAETTQEVQDIETLQISILESLTETQGIINSDRLVRVSAEGALAQEIDVLQATTGSLASLISSDRLVRVSAEAALAQDIETLQVATGGRISTAETNIIALQAADGTLQSNINAKVAIATYDADQKVNGNLRIAAAETNIGVLQAADGTLQSNINAKVAITTYNADQKVAGVLRIAAAESNIGVLQTASGDMRAQATIKLNVNNRVAGIGLMLSEDEPSEFIILADRFSIVNPDVNADVKVPFTLQEYPAGSDYWVLGLNADVIVNGSILADKLSVTSLSAISANLGEVTAGSIVIGTTNKLWLNDAADGALNIGGATKTSAFFRVSPTGVLTATTGTFVGAINVGDSHVVIDGANKVIKVYDENNVLRVELGLLS